MIELTRDPIDFTALTERVRSRNAGAVLLFLGTVREMTGEAITTHLDYDAYPELAVAEMTRLAEDAADRWPLEGVAIVHRLGRLELGEVSIAVAVSSPHRAECFDAGRWLIDELKVRVPIWKQEHWADGSSEWVHPVDTSTTAADSEPTRRSESKP